MTQTHSAIADFLNFLDQSPTPAHAVQAIVASCKYAVCLDEQKSWQLEPGKTYIVTKEGSTIFGFKMPARKSVKSDLGFRIISAHTDSPCLKLKPNPHKSVGNYVQWGCEVYGGVLLNSWLDRDLFMAGRVSVADSEGVHTQLINLTGRPVRIPQLAIHLDRAVNEQGLKLNAQNHLIPVLGLEGVDLLTEVRKELSRHHAVPIASNAELLLDICLYDSQKAALGGMNGEFIYSSRLDNLAMCHAALKAFIDSPSLDNVVNAFCFFDHEEVGSQSAQGAESSFLAHVMERIGESLGCGRPDWMAALARSRLISADMAHAVHPNYADKHDPDHHIFIGRGPVLKFNASQRYSTNSIGAAHIVHLGLKNNIPLQKFVCRGDIGCGTTIGPAISSALGVPAVDMGNPMLSMHSIREMAGVGDHMEAIKLFGHFYATN